MDIDELCGDVWHHLAHQNKAINVQDITDDLGLDATLVRKAIACLNQAGLLMRDAIGRGYQIKGDLNALEWAHAVEIGVRLNDLEQYARLKSGQKPKDILEVTLGNDLEKVKKKQKEARQKTQQALIEGRRATRVAQTDLAQLVNDIRQVSAREDVQTGDEYVQRALQEAQAEAEKALEALLKSMR